MKCILLVLAFLLLANLCTVDCRVHRKQATHKEIEETGKYGSLPHLNVHLMAHTHDDVGWLKTVDEYYYGANQTIQVAGVQYIIDTVVTALQQDPSRKFIYVEMAFFKRWWDEQTESMKTIVRDLVARGQLEIINGGWCMNDEATTLYSAIIDQMTFGHQFLWKEFGVKPRIGWHIDPFGHAASQASLFAQMGFDGFFFGRIDQPDHDHRNATKTLEFVWRPSTDFGEETEIWSHVLYDTYCFLDGFSFEGTKSPPIQDDPRLFDYNVKGRADSFASMVRDRSASFTHNNVLIPFGCDFAFQNAHMEFKNMDKLIKYINARPQVYGMTLKYSTPSIYLDAVHSAHLTWTVKYNSDFFPYGVPRYNACCEHTYWTGYFTSRPGIKGYVRNMNNLLHSTDKLFTAAGLGTSDNKYVDREAILENIDIMDDAFGIAQHHDAVTGTEKQHVANDYAKRLYIGSESCWEVIDEVLSVLVSNFSNNGDAPTFDFCPLLNVSSCPITEEASVNDTISIVLYNPIAWRRTDYFARIVVPTSSVTVFDYQGNSVAAQVQPNDDKSDKFTVIFPTDLPPLGYTTYFVRISATFDNKNLKGASTKVKADQVLENEYLRATISGSTGKLSSIYVKQQQLTLDVKQEYLWYNASAGNNPDPQASGAYILRPNGTNPWPLLEGNPVVTLVNGGVVQEVHQKWNSWFSSVIRLYKGQQHLELEATIEAIDISDGLGKEVISRYSTSLSTKGYFYTDSEGLQMMTRIRNYNPWPNFKILEPVAANYYPMNTAAYITDGQKQLTLVSDRSRGCSSLADGQLEDMMQRRLLYDDNQGVNEPLNETETVRTVDWLYVSARNTSARHQRKAALLLSNPPTLAFAKTSSPSDWIKSFSTKYSALSAALPDNVHLLNLKTMPNGQAVLRLHHIFSGSEDSQLSKPVVVDLQNMFSDLIVLNAVEMSLTANQEKSQMKRLQWKTNSANASPQYNYTPVKDLTKVQLRPMEIKTFIVRFMNAN